MLPNQYMSAAQQTPTPASLDLQSDEAGKGRWEGFLEEFSLV